MNLVFHSSELTDWCTGYVLHYATIGDSQKTAEAMATYNKFKSDVIDTITGYKLPVITLDKSTPREAVCKVWTLHVGFLYHIFCVKRHAGKGDVAYQLVCLRAWLA